MHWRLTYRLGEEVAFAIIKAESHKAAVRELLAMQPAAIISRVRSIMSEPGKLHIQPVKAEPRQRNSSRVLRAKRRGDKGWRGTTKVAQKSRKSVAA